MTGTDPFGGMLTLFLFVAAVFAGIAFLSWKVDQARHRRNKAFAEANGWSYIPRDDALIKVFATPPFGLGNRRKVTDAMRGDYRGHEALVFGYQYTTHSSDQHGGSSKTHHHRVCVVKIPGSMPLVRLIPESVFSRIATALGGTDVEVESEEFNRLWKVWSRDERAAHAILTPRMIERLLARDAVGQPLAFEPGFLMTYEKGKLDLPSSPIPLDLLGEIADLVPEFLAEDYR
ncbi:MAG: DUF3137 domain-containing protein [Actinobacteria bacterium]|nr:DUF3137 domain-containing protein [Actinomycetota bacterium]